MQWSVCKNRELGGGGGEVVMCGVVVVVVGRDVVDRE